MEMFFESKVIQPSVIVFDVFGTLVKISEKRSPYLRLMKWLKEQGRKPQQDDARFIMSHDVDFSQLAILLGMKIPDQFLIELESALEKDLQSISLYEDTLLTIEKLQTLGFRLGLCSNLAMPYGKVVSSLLPRLDAYAWSYEVGAIKPDPQIYRYLITQLGCHPRDVLFIGDTPLADVIAPTQFGMSARLIQRNNGQGFSDILMDILDK